MIDAAFINILRIRFMACLPALKHALAERYTIASNLVNAASVLDALDIFYSLELHRIQVRLQCERAFIAMMTDDEIAMIYKTVLTSALELAIQNMTNVSVTEKSELTKEIPAAAIKLLPSFLTAFKTNIAKPKFFLDVIHEEMSCAVRHSLARSTLFNLCDADLSSELEKTLDTQFGQVANVMDDISELDFEHEDLACAHVNLDCMPLRYIYRTISRENEIAKEALPEWKKAEDDQIGSTVPLLFEQQVKKDFAKHLENNKDLLARLSHEFFERFNLRLKTHASTVINSHTTMTPQERAQLCKTNTLLRLEYDREITAAATEFGLVVSSSFLRNYSYGFLLQHIGIQQGLEEKEGMFLCGAQSVFIQAIHEQRLESCFEWPQERVIIRHGAYSAMKFHASA